MTATISRLYDDFETASQAVGDCEAAGLRRADISVVASNADNWYESNRMRKTARNDRDGDGVDDRVEGAGIGGGIGAVVGGSAGLLAGLGMLAIPGVGPVVAAGWLVASAAGAVAGAATGGIVGALTQVGASSEDAHVYAEGVRRGGTLVTVRVPEGERVRYEAILDRAAVNIRDRAAAYRTAGWTEFDPDAPPYSVDQVPKERQYQVPDRMDPLSLPEQATRPRSV